MKKIFSSILATVIMFSVAVYADGGKKAAKKTAHEKEYKKAKCPNRPGCICH